MKQLHAYFSGQVQGVGLRYSVKEIADSLGLTGFVKNLPDGRVELLAEGNKVNLEKLLDEIKETFAIQDVKITWQDADNKYSSFKIDF